MHQTTLHSGTSLPLTLVVERCEVQVGRWTTPRWQVISVIGGDVKPERVEGVEMQTSADCICRIWTDLDVTLYKDAAESYLHNLHSKQPRLFVICRPDEASELLPFMVSADQNEAEAFMEADDTVLSTAMPAEICQWVEQFVAQHFRPRAPKKSRRRQSEGDPLYGKT